MPEVQQVSILVSTQSSSSSDFLTGRFSNYGRMLRVVARIRRWLKYRRHEPVCSVSLSILELRDALTAITRYVQRKTMSDLIVELQNRRPVSSKAFSRLMPFIDDNGIVRVGGRLQNADLHEHQKHPILLTRDCHLAMLLCQHWHRVTCHSGPRLIVSLIVRHFWIISVRVLVRRVATMCSTCVRLAAVNPQPLMADLPTSRVQQCRVFQRVGIDYAGPFSFKETSLRKSRVYKGYVAIFVCFAVKATHLEVVSSLSTEAFLATLDRFVARRGIPTDIHSDCGTNFIGAANVLRSLIQTEDARERIEASIPAHWHFNPPSAPHFGGLWEAAVRAMKARLTRVLCNHVPTYEEFTTLITRVEAVLNSRPLTPMSADPQDLDYLTPGHFLIGQPLLAIPYPPTPEISKNQLQRWKLFENCQQSFWKLWSQDYLHTLQQRSKWTKEQPNIAVGDMVVIKENNTSPLVWRLGRVTGVILGKDKIARVAQLHTINGQITRPIVKLVLLPTS
ncbi:uncharacterized protein LOC126896151 [Daktulosphaira vitifoliae]|uniref:uncharacterized protein LOC126896151 n=1 Tax=Daktulosphaira vitifoliae TaxID=58002 RepID=UPI0021AA6409|nr:uncharacterized protein LOC126896151 [Daktulosphaira vitifoliae]